MRLSAPARTLLLAVLASIPFATVRGQAQSRGESPFDSLPSARVILIPAVDRFNFTWATSTAIEDYRVLAVYTTGGTTSRALATRVQAIVGGPIIALDRAGKGVDDFARLIVDTIVEKTARNNMRRAIFVVIEPDLILPLLHGAFSGGRPLPFKEARLGTYIISVRADNLRRLSLRPATLDRDGGKD